MAKMGHRHSRFREAFSFILSIAWKWLGDKEVSAKALPHYDDYFKSVDVDDKHLVHDLWKLLDTADIVVAQNGDAFDIKKSNARFLIHGLNPPSNYRTVDTLKLAKKYFKFDSNSLDDLSRLLGLGEKLKHPGFGLWKGCLEGNLQAWETMVDYNKRDVVLLEKLYLRLRPWAQNHPNVNAPEIKGFEHCNTCGSENVQRRGFIHTRLQTRQRWNCTSCGSWYTGAIVKKSDG
jgi:hypothetical protein